MWRLVLQSLLISSLAISAIHNNLLKHGYFFHLFFFFQTTLGTIWLIYSRIIIDMINYLSKCILWVEIYTVYCCQGNSHVTVIFYYWDMYHVKKKRLCTMLFFIYQVHGSSVIKLFGITVFNKEQAMMITLMAFHSLKLFYLFTTHSILYKFPTLHVHFLCKCFYWASKVKVMKFSYVLHSI